MKKLRFINVITTITFIVTCLIIIIQFNNKNIQNSVHKTLFLDRTFSEQEIIYITEAALEWSIATNYIVKFDIHILPNNKHLMKEDDIVINKVSQDHVDVLLIDSMNNNSTLGLWQGNGPIKNIKLVTSRLTPQSYKGVVLHELGHALGLKHNEGFVGIGTLMYPNIDFGANEITDMDLKQFCNIYKCNSQN